MRGDGFPVGRSRLACPGLHFSVGSLSLSVLRGPNFRDPEGLLEGQETLLNPEKESYTGGRDKERGQWPQKQRGGNA